MNASALDAPSVGPITFDPSKHTPHDSMGYLMRRIVTSMGADIERAMEPLGLTNAQWRPLGLMHIGPPKTVAELARECFLDTSAMTRLLDRLEAKGYCTRTRSVEDRRVVTLGLTDAGREAALHIPGVLADIQNTYLQGFSPDEWSTLKGLLQRVLANSPCAANQATP
ncbi:MAG TPA: MarR family transcriptional regulator [Rhodoferax sp.]|jgi:DNA-binding MarR family transcriptional regulator|nr:MarR family transcriptional regulator [Rhodoferax sp.]